MIGWVIVAVVVLVAGGALVWRALLKFAEAPQGPKLNQQPDPPAKKYRIVQGSAAMFLVEDRPAGEKTGNYLAVWEAVTDYPQTRAGAEAFLTAMATKVNGDWFRTFAKVDTQTVEESMSQRATLRKLQPMDELELEPDSDDTKEQRAVRVLSNGKQVGILESTRADEITQAMESDTCLLCFTLEVTDANTAHPGVEFGILRWEEAEAD